MSEIENILMTLLENAIIEETHYITEREHVNTLEDVVSELLYEYKELANGDNKEQETALHKPDVIFSEAEVCPLCKNTGEYSFGGSFGGSVQTQRCPCGRT
jgi:hypothetical protein